MDGHARAEVIAHRGASGYAPENTLEALDLAVAQGADVLEVDVRAAGDGELVVTHDPTLERTIGDPRAVGQLTAEDLAALDHPGRPVRLAEVLERYAGEQRLLLDLKDPEPAWEGRIPELVERWDGAERTVVQSFDEDALGRLHDRAPWLALGALYRRATSLGLDVAAVPGFATSVGLWHVAVDEAVVAAARARGLAVRPWTVDEPEEAERLLGLGVDALITNVPDVMVAAVRAPDPAVG